MNRTWKTVLGVVVAVAVVGVGAFNFVANKTEAVEGPAVTLSHDETDPEAFKLLYPSHYDSWARTAEMNEPVLKYGSSEEKKSRLEQFPYMKTLWNGNAFAKEYNEARGHAYVLEDLLSTKRINEKTNLTCMYCKSAEVPGLIAQMGNDFYNTKLLADNNTELFKHPVSCSDCHVPETMELRITRPALVEAMARRGFDVSKATRQEMRSLVCAQCHVEYFFDANDNNKVALPWDKGFEPEEMYAFYQEIGFSDFTHAQTQGGILKAQHPEFETFQGSVHQRAGLSCADCHMPYVTEGSTKISSHWLTSPFRTFEQSCTQCHKESQEEMGQRVLNTQDRVKEALDRAGKANEAAILAIEKAIQSGADAAELDKARALHREAQWYWDLASAENSFGFHNPQKALETLADSIDLAHQAELIAAQAAK